MMRGALAVTGEALGSALEVQVDMELTPHDIPGLAHCSCGDKPNTLVSACAMTSMCL
jgi:hypothetical protein